MADAIKLTYDYLDVPLGDTKLTYSVAPLLPINKPPFIEPDDLADSEWLKDGNYWDSFYVKEDNNKLQLSAHIFIGPETPSGATSAGGYGQVFHLEKDIVFESCVIKTTSTGNLTVQLYKFNASTQNPNQGTLVDSVVVNISSTGEQEINLGLQTDGAGDYWLGHQATFNLYRTDELGIFPVIIPNIGTVDIARNFAISVTAPRWYYYFNLRISLVDISGYRISNPLNLNSFPFVGSSNIQWSENKPEDTDIKIYTAITDTHAIEPEEEEWLEATNDGKIPGVDFGDNLTGKFLWCKQVLTSEDEEVTPELIDIEYNIEGDIIEVFDKQETLKVSDSFGFRLSHEKTDFEEDVIVSDSFKFLSKVLHHTTQHEENVKLSDSFDFSSKSLHHKVDYEESIELSDAHTFLIHAIQKKDSFKVSDSFLLDRVIRGRIEREDNFTVSDSFEFISKDLLLNLNTKEDVVISDSFSFERKELFLHFEAEETINFGDDVSFEEPIIFEGEDDFIISDFLRARRLEKIDYPIKILSYNPLIIIGKSPVHQSVKIIKVHKEDLDDIYWEAKIIKGTENPNNFYINDTNEYVYILCDDGKIKKVWLNDFEEIIYSDTFLEKDFLLGEIWSKPLRLYAINDDKKGEIVVLDERIVKKVSLDITFLETAKDKLPLNVQTTIGKILPLNITALEVKKQVLGLKICFNQYDYSSISSYPTTHKDIQIKIGGEDLVPVNDIDLSSVKITHYVGSRSVATFSLHRYFDNPNKTNEGNLSIITSHNLVEIYINGVEEFRGYICRISPSSLSETILVEAMMPEPAPNKKNITLPITEQGEKLHLYDCLVSNINIDNPYIDPNEENPDYYLGVEVDLGISREQNVQRWETMYSVLDEIREGTFEPEQNWTYFWSVSVRRFWESTMFGRQSHLTTQQYIGTSMSPVSGSDFELTYASYRYQRQREDTQKHLGYRREGQKPFLTISTPNGKYITRDRWEDKTDGLYKVKDEGFDFVPVAKQHAEIEYKKLFNINGDILPITRCDIELSLDAYQYYDIKLLSRINLSNTKENNIYNKNNGFPVAIKSITIDLSTMRTHITADNQLSQKELDELEKTKISEESYITPKQEILNYQKYGIIANRRIV